MYVECFGCGALQGPKFRTEEEAIEAWNTRANRPPYSLYNILHQFEASGDDIPDDLENWWFRETVMDQRGLPGK